MANELDLKKIIAPKLNQAGYGANLSQVFDNIDTNFKILGNQDFVKGDRGFSLKSVGKRLLADNDTFSEDGIKALKAILKLADTSNSSLAGILDNLDDYKVETIKQIFERKNDSGDYVYPEVAPVSGISMIDYITYDIVFNVIMSYDPENEPNSEKVVGALNNFTFKDARYVHAKSYSDSEYESRFDFSCLLNLYVDGDNSYGFQTLQNTPTLYYDKNVKCFCWKVSGIETGIIAQGPQGNDGEHAKLYIVKVDVENNGSWKSEDNKMYKITHYLDGNTWSDVFPTNWVGSGCVAFGKSINDNPPHLTFISSISEENRVFCSDANSVHPQITANAIKNGLFLASYESELLSGLFLPIDKYSPGSSTAPDNVPVHLLWGVPKGSSDTTKKELHITPLSSYSSVKDIGSELASLPIGDTLDTANDRLKVLYSKCHNGASIVFDYPEVIIKGHDTGNDGSFLGIGVSYKEPLKTDDGKEKQVPRLKLGSDGILEVGTDNDNGLLCVNKISSSWNNSTPLNLESTARIINLGAKSDPHTVNIYNELRVFDSIYLLDGDRNRQISLSYSLDNITLQFGNDAKIVRLGEGVLEINSVNGISLQSREIKIGTKQKNTMVDCTDTQFNMEWNIDNIRRDMQVGGRFDSLKTKVNQIWSESSNSTKEQKEITTNKIYFDKKVSDARTFSESVNLANISDVGLLDLFGLSKNKISITITTNVTYKTTGFRRIHNIKRTCNCNVSLYYGKEKLYETAGADSHLFSDYVGLNWGQRDKVFTFDMYLSNNLKSWISRTNNLTLKISASFNDSINHNGLAGGIKEKDVYIQTKSEMLSSKITLTTETLGGRILHSDYLNGAILLGTYKHRNIGIYCEGFEDEFDGKDWGYDKKNNQTGIFMSFLDKKGKPCYAIITARDLFVKIHGNGPEEYEAGVSGSPLHSF